MMRLSRRREREAWTVGSLLVHSGRARRSGGAWLPPGVADPPPPCALLSSNGKTTRPAVAFCALFFTAAEARVGACGL